jgi:hypothetical protein
MNLAEALKGLAGALMGLAELLTTDARANAYADADADADADGEADGSMREVDALMRMTEPATHDSDRAAITGARVETRRSPWRVMDRTWMRAPQGR